MEENFLLLFRFDNPLDSSVEFMKVRILISNMTAPAHGHRACPAIASGPRHFTRAQITVKTPVRLCSGFLFVQHVARTSTHGNGVVDVPGLVALNQP